MKIPRQDVEFLINHLKDLEFALQACDSSVFTDDFARDEPHTISSSVAKDIIEKLDAIINDCDVTALSKSGVSSATAIGDSAYLLKRALENADTVIVAADPRLTEEENFLSQFYVVSPKLSEERLTLVSNDYLDSIDYARKALELLKPLARTHNFDIDALEIQGELYL